MVRSPMLMDSYSPFASFFGALLSTTGGGAVPARSSFWRENFLCSLHELYCPRPPHRPWNGGTSRARSALEERHGRPFVAATADRRPAPFC